MWNYDISKKVATIRIPKCLKQDKFVHVLTKHNLRLNIAMEGVADSAGIEDGSEKMAWNSETPS